MEVLSIEKHAFCSLSCAKSLSMFLVYGCLAHVSCQAPVQQVLPSLWLEATTTNPLEPVLNWNTIFTKGLPWNVIGPVLAIIGLVLISKLGKFCCADTETLSPAACFPGLRLRKAL